MADNLPEQQITRPRFNDPMACKTVFIGTGQTWEGEVVGRWRLSYSGSSIFRKEMILALFLAIIFPPGIP